MAVGIAGLVLHTNRAEATIITQATTVIGPSGAALIQQMLSSVNRPTGNIFAIAIGGLTTVIGALGIFSQLRDALDTIWHNSSSTRGFKKTAAQYFTSFLLLLGVSSLLLVSLITELLLTIIARSLGGSLLIWHYFDLIASFGLTLLLFALLFRTASSRAPHWRVVWPAATLTAFLFTVGKYVISAYLTHSSVASAYGVAGSLTIILLWLYYSAQIVLFGAEYLRVLETPLIQRPLLRQLFLLSIIPLARRILRRR